jgi:hypothetical protein
MTDQVLIITEPDDTLLDSYRILLVDLTPEQSQVVSASLLTVSLSCRVVLYSWNSANTVTWLLDKKAKCDAILFNADSNNDVIVGYLAAQTNSYYFGNLKSLAGVNNSQLYAQQDCQELLEYMITKNDKK